MPRKASPTQHSNALGLPFSAYDDLRSLRDELLNVANTIDPAINPSPSVRKTDQSRHRALASVFRTWADQVDRSLESVRPA